MKQLAERLRSELPGAAFEYTTVLVDGEIGFLEWTAAQQSHPGALDEQALRSKLNRLL